ncbi:thioesterase II family protein [Cryptosporangium minutisporangium]|uniref:Alpha/beta fold hydrolase n=1 Tax=Cryptosporangium minutisporangium TaxID=113569 RepID=A0ABP6T266_9ACTN
MLTWFRRPLPRPDATVRLVCFPHAGGSASFYRWLADLDPGVEVLLVQYPGRENRIAEPMPETMGALVDAVVAALPPGPVAVFGHSMGASVAYEVARRVPVRALVVSGQPAPRWHRSGVVLDMSDADVLAAIRRLGGTASAVLDDPDLREMVVDVMGGDLRLLRTYTPTPAEPPLEVPVRALAGASDPAAPPEQVADWRTVTTGPFDLTTLPGGHFSLVEHAAAVRAEILAALRTA